ncbi:MAG TPA: hypothetical protein VNR18_07040 [Hyphomicrobiales bacterium]|nr:hypothetical protein [Hyphomicrobiales bacterium]
MKHASGILAALLTLAILPFQAGVANAQQQEATARPAPRHDDGRINFGPPPGETGMWSRGTKYLAVNPDSYQADQTLDAPIHLEDVPLQPWARALTKYRMETLFLASEPYTRCKVAGGPRQIMSPYGYEIVDIPELQQIYIMNISNSMSYRIIYLDGRGHPEPLRPTYFGHSIGHWEGDTLVVDTVGMNERSWMNRDGFPNTEQLHLVERFTRTDFDTLEYVVTLDDPGVFTAPWTSGYTVKWAEDEEMFEYMCQENNLAPAELIGNEGTSVIVP